MSHAADSNPAKAMAWAFNVRPLAHGVDPTRSTKPSPTVTARSSTSRVRSATERRMARAMCSRSRLVINAGVTAMNVAVPSSAARARASSVASWLRAGMRSVRNRLTAASAMRATAAPITRVNDRVGVSPNSAAPASNDSTSSTTVDGKPGWPGSPGSAGSPAASRIRRTRSTVVAPAVATSWTLGAGPGARRGSSEASAAKAPARSDSTIVSSATPRLSRYSKSSSRSAAPTASGS